MNSGNYLLIENEDSVTSVDLKVIYDSENVQVKFTKTEGNTRKEVKTFQGRRPANFNIDLLKAAFQVLGQKTGLEKDTPEQIVQDINLSFSDLSYSVTQGLKRETKCILNKLHGEFRAGELTAIMGPSGAGKSSLMEIMAGFTTSGVTGSIRTNGNERDLRTFARQSCYIMQDDELCPLLTVYEAMTMAAHLKLGPTVKRKQERITRILESLRLYHHKRTMTGKLSGGQRKRLAIALELVSNPPIMFFDEPTSGLDSSTSKRCVALLKNLAECGRTIICTIHQPNASLFEIFDHVYALRTGECIYSGGTKGLVNFLANNGLQCPQYHSLADYLLEVATLEDYKKEVEQLVLAIDNGKRIDWRKRPAVISDFCSPSPESGENIFNLGEKTEKGKKRKTHHQTNFTYPTSLWKQFSTITIRNFKKISRDKFFTRLQLVAHILLGFLIGILFYDIGNDAAFVSDNFSLLFFCIMLNMYTSYSSAISYFPKEMPILLREHFNKWYSLKAYYVATNITGIPIKFASSFLYISIVYFMTAQPMEVDRFVKCTLIILLVGFVAQGYGYLIGSVMNVQNASVFGPLMTAPFILFSGFFVLINDAPYSLKWLFHASYFKYALEGVMIAVFGNNRKKMNCSHDYCHFIVPEKFLQQVGMEKADYWFDVGVLIGIGFLLRIMTYYTLRFRLQFFKKNVL